jgi:hypothetical protein
LHIYHGKRDYLTSRANAADSEPTTNDLVGTPEEHANAVDDVNGAGSQVHHRDALSTDGVRRVLDARDAEVGGVLVSVKDQVVVTT